MISSVSHLSGDSFSGPAAGRPAPCGIALKNSPGARASLRVDHANPDHHIWNNNGTWWFHYTEHLPDYTKRRVRVSLRTADIEAARRRRDELLAALAGAAAN